VTECEIPLHIQFLAGIALFIIILIVFWAASWVAYYAGVGYATRRRERNVKNDTIQS
jgi:hypothetical protein